MKNPFLETEEEKPEPVNAFLYPERVEQQAAQREAETKDAEREMTSRTLRLPRKR